MTQTVKPEKARVDVASNQVVVVDVRDSDEWTDGAERIPGSVHIPADQIEDRLGELPDDKPILLVSPDGELGSEIAERLSDADREVRVLEGGVEGWKSDRFLTQPSPDADPPKPEGAEPHEAPADEGESET